MVFLQSHGVSTHYAIKIYKAYGSQAVELVRENPYRLAIDIHGIGFKTADRIAAALGHLPRARRSGWRPARSTCSPRAADRGHLYLPRPALIEDAAKLLGLAAGPDRPRHRRPGRGRSGGRGARSARRRTTRARPRSISKALHTAETGVATRVRDLLIQPPLPFEIDVERALDWFEKTERHRARPPAAAGDALRTHPQGAGHHRRPGHRQDHPGARRSSRSWRRSGRRSCSRRPPAARPSGWPRPPAARRPRSTACWSSTRTPAPSSATGTTRCPATC